MEEILISYGNFAQSEKKGVYLELNDDSGHSRIQKNSVRDKKIGILNSFKKFSKGICHIFQHFQHFPLFALLWILPMWVFRSQSDRLFMLSQQSHATNYGYDKECVKHRLKWRVCETLIGRHLLVAIIAGNLSRN